MLRDPAYRKAQVEDWLRRLAQPHADAIRVVGMTPGQADRVIELWAERNLRFTELGADTGEAPSEAVQAELKRAADAEQAEVRELLGEERNEKWAWYLASGQERAEVGQFRLQLSSTSEPLRDSQADALVEAIYSERQRRSRDYENYAKAMGTDRNMASAQDRQRWLDLEEAGQRAHPRLHGRLTFATTARVPRRNARVATRAHRNRVTHAARRQGGQIGLIQIRSAAIRRKLRASCGVRQQVWDSFPRTGAGVHLPLARARRRTCAQCRAARESRVISLESRVGPRGRRRRSDPGDSFSAALTRCCHIRRWHGDFATSHGQEGGLGGVPAPADARSEISGSPTRTGAPRRMRRGARISFACWI